MFSFHVERGVVEILPNENVLELFEEIHWCAHQIRKLSHKRCKSTAEFRTAVTKARLLVSDTEAAEEELFIANRRLVVSSDNLT